MENVTKRFGKVVANNAINLELHEGEILSLLGENGSGKTTLMNMLSGIYFPDEGHSRGTRHDRLPQGCVRTRHRYDPPALQAR